ncbi:MAG TPA: T9SS type A sorting domain-containing protein [Chitinophagales bacterium]|nr:T9SS type A sorting domain-containing protein [Chitinophagales bacterium]
MKKIFTLLTSLCLALWMSVSAFGQTYPPETKIWGASPFQDSLWSLDPVTFQIEDRIGPTLPGFTITGMNGMAFDPCEFKTYIICKVSGVTGRVLCTIDLPTGVCTQVGNLGDNFSSITFRKDGQLFGVTGNGATVPETLYEIDKTNGNKTLAAALGAGADGEVICYNPVDDLIYHWSGNTTVVFEKVLATAPYTATNIPITGTTNGETFGAMHWRADTFLISNISSSFNLIKTSGQWGPQFGSNPDDLRGLVMPPAFAIEDDSVCNGTAINIGAAGVNDYKVIYAWGDGSRDTVQSGSGTHTYNGPGNYTVNVLLDYGGCAPDTFWSKAVRVNAVPVVTISGFNGICPGGSVTLTGTSGGTSQWYVDGNLIPLANSNTYTTSTPGTYNMVKTNLTGCADSAAVGKTLTNVSNPVVALGNDVTQCGGTVTLDAGNAGAAYSWSNATSSQTLVASSTNTYTVTVTDANNCSASDEVDVTINTVPTVDLGNDVVQCGGTAGLFAGNAGATYAWSDNSSAQILVATASGTYSVTVTDANTCTATDEVDVTINPVPTVDLGSDVIQCGGTTTLDAGNAGATYDWSDNSSAQTLVVSASGTYSVTITDVNICTASDEVDVTINAVPTVDLGSDVTQCGGTTTLDAGNAGATYDWSDNSSAQTLVVSASGTYSVTITDANTCTASDEVDVTINTVPTVDLGNDVTQCGGTTTLNAGNAGSTYDWSDNSSAQTLVVSASGTYSVTITDANTCTATDEVDVTINTVPTVDLGSDVTQCGGTTTLDAGNAGATYDWSDNSSAQTLVVSASGTYSVTITDANTCTATGEVDVTINTIPTVDLGSDVTQCGGTTALDAGNAGATYDWSDNSSAQTLVVSASGTYSVTITDANTCTATDEVDVTINTVPSVDLGSDVTQCGGTTTLDAGNAGATYDWSDNSSAQTLVVSASGTYSVTITDANTCTATDEVDVTINTIPTVTLTLPVDSACFGEGAVTLSGGSPAGGSFFGVGVTNNEFAPTTIGNNVISYAFTDVNGCADTAEAGIVVFVCVGINQLSQGSIVLYPNPSSDFVTLKSIGVEGKMEVAIMDVTGRTFQQWNGISIASGYSHTFNLNQFTKGIYIVNVNTPKGSASYNLVIE